MRLLKVRIVEGIQKGDSGQESIAIAELLRMLDLLKAKAARIPAGSTTQSFLTAILDGSERFVHVSSHGNGNKLVVKRSPKIKLSGDDAAAFIEERPKYKNAMSGRFLSISACGTMNGNFPTDFGVATNAAAVVAPMASVNFAESALFYTMFYYALGTHPSIEETGNTAMRLAQYIDAFQRAKAAFLSLGGSGAYRLDWWINRKHFYLM